MKLFDNWLNSSANNCSGVDDSSVICKITSSNLANSDNSVSNSSKWVMPMSSSQLFANGYNDIKPCLSEGLSKTLVLGIFGTIVVTEKQSELLKTWGESSSVEEFRVKTDAQFSEISTDDFIVICEHAMDKIRGAKIWHKKKSLNDKFLDIILEDDIFDEHVVKPEIYRHFATESMRCTNNDSHEIAQALIDICLEKKHMLENKKSQ